MRCLHCYKTGYLICHGFLRGYGEEDQIKRALIRGKRYFCSNRDNKKGCGRTFSIHWAHLIERKQISANSLYRFLKGISLGRSVKESFDLSSLSLKTAYRLKKLFVRQQSQIRTCMIMALPPPDSSLALTSPAWTLSHLETLFSCAPCPIAAFQYRFQKSFL